MSGVLMQVVGNSGIPHRLHNNSAMNILTHECSFTPVRFDINNSFIIQRECDVIKSIFFKFKMAALPSGWVYINKWTSRAFESITLHIGGMPVLKYDKARLRLMNLIFPDDMRANSRHLTFDYSLSERMDISLEPHETMFEFDIRDVFGENGIPLVALQYHSVNVNFTLGDFTDCVESSREDGGIFPFDTNYIIECVPQSVGIFMDSTPRSELATMSHTFNTIRYDHVSIIASTDETWFNLAQGGICSSAYIHITNEDGSEIDRQVLDSIDIELNRQSRFNLSGFQSRHLMSDYLPHPVRDNSDSQNLYYIAYNPPPQFSTIPIEPLPTLNVFGVNLDRIDSHHMIVTYNPDVPLPPRIKITIMHRTHNVFNISNGWAIYSEPLTQIHISTETRRVAVPRVAVPVPVVIGANSISIYAFVPSDTHISIPSDDKCCLITLEPILENADVVQCQQCKKLCLLAAMNEWFKVEKNCPHCRAHSDRVDFIVGKGKEWIMDISISVPFILV